MEKERRDNKNRKLRNGEYQREDGRYEYRYSDFNGRQRSVYSWTLTQTDRTPTGKRHGKCLRDLEKEIAIDETEEIDRRTASKVTVNELFDQYILTRNDLKKTTLALYLGIYNRLLRNGIGKMKVANVRYNDIVRCYQDILGPEKKKKKNLDMAHTLLNCTLNTAVNESYIRNNPASNAYSTAMKSSKYKEKEIIALSIVEQKTFMSFIRGHELYNRLVPLFTFMFGTGCRIGEALGVRWEDCDFEHNTISINHTLVYRKYPGEKTDYHIQTPKTRSGIRSIPMLKEVKDELLKEYKRQQKYGFTKGTVDGYSGFVFQNKKGGLQTIVNIDKSIWAIVQRHNNLAIEKAKANNSEPFLLPKFSSHSIRHTFCTRLCESETNLKVIQYVMGHSDITMTLNKYAACKEAKRQEEFLALEGKVVY